MKYRFAIFHLGKDLDSKNTSKGFFSTKVGQRNEPFAQSGRDWSLLETCLEQDLCFFSLVRLCPVDIGPGHCHGKLCMEAVDAASVPLRAVEEEGSASAPCAGQRGDVAQQQRQALVL